MNAPQPPDESQRLKSLLGYDVLDSLPEPAFDDLALLAAQICRTPIALISFLDESRQWFKARHGLEVRETRREISFCSHAILEKDRVMEVPDAREDPRFANNELVTGDPHIRFYAGAPLIAPDGQPLGTLCVLDHKPHQLDAAQAVALQALSRHVVAQLELRRRNVELRNSELETKRLLAMAKQSRTALLGVLEDEQRTSNRLRESEARFRELAENIDECFWISDPLKQKFLYISPAYETIWQRTCDSLYTTPRSWLDAVHPEDRSSIEAAANGLADGYSETYRILRPDGNVRWIHDRAFPVCNQDGEILRVVGTAKDITDNKILEANSIRAQRLESIGTLAGGIAHDLNNALAPIMMSVELLKMRDHDAHDLDLLTTIEGSAKRGADMVRQLLSYARGVEGRQLPVRIADLLANIEKITNETFLKNIQVRCEIPSDLWCVTGDPTQLHQVFINLCVNARDAMPNGGTLTLTAENLILDADAAAMNDGARPGPHVRILVSDNGTGIPRKVLERIFEPFYTTREIGKGTGLGLPTSMGIIKSHGGVIRVDSEVGTGSQFHVYLPARSESDADAMKTEAPTNGLPRGNGELVLVVDDEANVRQITRQTLEAFGYRVLLATDGIDATSTFATHQQEIDLVLTDMMMPHMDGPATIQVLMRMNPNLPIIAASGLHTDNMIAKATNAGAKHFIPKPYTSETLLRSLRIALENQLHPLHR